MDKPPRRRKQRHTATSTVAAETRKDYSRSIEKLRSAADAMEPQIQEKLSPAISDQRITARRARIAEQMAADGRHLQKIQTGMRVIATALEEQTCPEVLQGISGKGHVFDLLMHNKLSICSATLQKLLINQENFEAAKAALAALMESAVPTEDPIALQIKQCERRLLGCKIPGYFPTPVSIGRDLVALADIQPRMSVLEPSAGKGDLADLVREVEGVELSVIERQSSLSEILSLKGFEIVGDDFLEYQGQYDRIVMNPPFEKFQDIQHVRHAYACLKPGGRLVAIMGAAAFFRDTKIAVQFRAWLESLGGQFEKLPDGAFLSSDRPTGVATYQVVIDKPGIEQAEPEEDPYQLHGGIEGSTDSPDRRWKIGDRCYYAAETNTATIQEFSADEQSALLKMDVPAMLRGPWAALDRLERLSDRHVTNVSLLEPGALIKGQTLQGKEYTGEFKNLSMSGMPTIDGENGKPRLLVGGTIVRVEAAQATPERSIDKSPLIDSLTTAPISSDRFKDAIANAARAEIDIAISQVTENPKNNKTRLQRLQASLKYFEAAPVEAVEAEISNDPVEVRSCDRCEHGYLQTCAEGESVSCSLHEFAGAIIAGETLAKAQAANCSEFQWTTLTGHADQASSPAFTSGDYVVCARNAPDSYHKALWQVQAVEGDRAIVQLFGIDRPVDTVALADLEPATTEKLELVLRDFQQGKTRQDKAAVKELLKALGRLPVEGQTRTGLVIKPGDSVRLKSLPEPEDIPFLPTKLTECKIGDQVLILDTVDTRFRNKIGTVSQDCGSNTYEVTVDGCTCPFDQKTLLAPPRKLTWRDINHQSIFYVEAVRGQRFILRFEDSDTFEWFVDSVGEIVATAPPTIAEQVVAEMDAATQQEVEPVVLEPERQVLEVDPITLERLVAAYSADKLAKNTIHSTVEWGDRQWVCVGVRGKGKAILQVDAVEVVLPERWSHPKRGYAELSLERPFSYEGQLVTHKHQSWVMTGNRVEFVPKAANAQFKIGDHVRIISGDLRGAIVQIVEIAPEGIRFTLAGRLLNDICQPENLERFEDPEALGKTSGDFPNADKTADAVNQSPSDGDSTVVGVDALQPQITSPEWQLNDLVEVTWDVKPPGFLDALERGDIGTIIEIQNFPDGSPKYRVLRKKGCWQWLSAEYLKRPGRVTNVKDENYETYIGRANRAYGIEKSKWCNPYAISRKKTREEALQEFENYLLGNQALLADLPELESQTVGCWCCEPGQVLTADDPIRCHGQILFKALRGDYADRIQPPEPESPTEVAPSALKFSQGDRIVFRSNRGVVSRADATGIRVAWDQDNTGNYTWADVDSYDFALDVLSADPVREDGEVGEAEIDTPSGKIKIQWVPQVSEAGVKGFDLEFTGSPIDPQTYPDGKRTLFVSTHESPHAEFSDYAVEMAEQIAIDFFKVFKQETKEARPIFRKLLKGSKTTEQKTQFCQEMIRECQTTSVGSWWQPFEALRLKLYSAEFMRLVVQTIAELELSKLQGSSVEKVEKLIAEKERAAEVAHDDAPDSKPADSQFKFEPVRSARHRATGDTLLQGVLF